MANEDDIEFIFYILRDLFQVFFVPVRAEDCLYPGAKGSQALFFQPTYRKNTAS